MKNVAIIHMIGPHSSTFNKLLSAVFRARRTLWRNLVAWQMLIQDQILRNNIMLKEEGRQNREIPKN
jgi:hypothetical protein